MTEAEWLASLRSMPMLLHLRAKVSERKILLFNCVCCRQVWELLGPADREAVVRGEQGADDPDAIRELEANLDVERVASLVLAGLIEGSVSDETRATITGQTTLRIGLLSRNAAIGVLAREAAGLASKARARDDQQESQLADELEQTALVRDIFGNPFRPPAFDPAWRTDTAVAVARTMYDSRDFGAMPILADALQDAGCEDEHILHHCRDTSAPHVRGCWVCDLVLNKS